jgi:hypothetical protein
MNTKQREILTAWYEAMIRCRINSDPAGFMGDAASYFEFLSKTDEKLKKMLNEKFEEIRSEDPSY